MGFTHVKLENSAYDVRTNVETEFEKLKLLTYYESATF
jgi:hypothetical protein